MAKVGIDGNRPLTGSGGIAPQLAPEIVAGTGTEVVRLNFILGDTFASPDDAGWISTYTRLIDQLRAAGVAIYGLVGDEIMPGGHRNLFRDPPESAAADDWIEDYVTRFKKIVDRFHDRVTTFESINEPNDFKQGHQAAFHPRWFARILARVYREAKRQAVTLVSGPLFTHDIPPSGDDGSRYLADTYRFGRRNEGWDGIRAETGSFPLDGVGLHLYVCQGPDRDAEAVRITFQDRIDRFARAIDTVEERPGSKPIYVTEFGWPSNVDRRNFEDLQASKLEAAFDVLLRHPRVELASLFCMQDFPNAFYGIYRSDSLLETARKPAFTRFRTIAQANSTNPHRVVTTGHQFVQGFADFVHRNPDVDVGEPIEEQWYSQAPSGNTFAFQSTTNGLLIWSKEHNLVRFVRI